MSEIFKRYFWRARFREGTVTTTENPESATAWLRDPAVAMVLLVEHTCQQGAQPGPATVLSERELRVRVRVDVAGGHTVGWLENLFANSDDEGGNGIAQMRLDNGALLDVGVVKMSVLPMPGGGQPSVGKKEWS
jgi:hypothetical protein